MCFGNGNESIMNQFNCGTHRCVYITYARYPPTNCAMMYARVGKPGIFPPTNIARVTAGLKYPPDTAPPKRTITASVTPIANPPHFSPAKRKMTLMKMKVPTSSTKSLLGRVYIGEGRVVARMCRIGNRIEGVGCDGTG